MGLTTQLLRTLLEARGELEKKPPQIAMAIACITVVIQALEALESMPHDDERTVDKSSAAAPGAPTSRGLSESVKNS